jgi:hypothetical protein
MDEMNREICGQCGAPVATTEPAAWGVRCHATGDVWYVSTNLSEASLKAEEYDDTLVRLYV